MKLNGELSCHRERENENNDVELEMLSSATKHAMPSQFGEKWRTEYLNTRFPLPTLLCAGYSVKLIYLFNFFQLISKARGNLILYETFCFPFPIKTYSWAFYYKSISHENSLKSKLTLQLTLAFKRRNCDKT